MRSLLLFDVLADDGDGRAATASGKVRRRPQRTAPKLVANGRVFFSRIIRPETPLRLFTTDETETLGG